MKSNSIENLIKEKNLNGGHVSSSPKPKKRRRRLYEDPVEEERGEAVVEQVIKVDKIKDDVDLVKTMKEEESDKEASRKIVRKKKSKAKEIRQIDLSPQDPLVVPRKEFIKTPNKFLDTILLCNFTALELRMVLYIFRRTVGWGKEYAFITRGDFENEGGVADRSFDRTKKSLLSNGVIEIMNVPSDKSSAYYLKSSFFRIEKEVAGETSESQSVENPVRQFYSEYIKLDESKNIVIEKEKIHFNNLLSQGHSELEILSLVRHLKDKGALDGSPCSNPFAYLSSAYESVKSRHENKVLIDGLKIKKLIQEKGTNLGLLPEIKSELTDKEIEKVDALGGWNRLGQMSDDKFNREFGIQ